MTVNLKHNKGDEIMQKYRRFVAWIGLILGVGIITIHIPSVQHFLVSHASERATQQVTRKNVTHNELRKGNFDAAKTTQANAAMELQNLRNSKHAPVIGKLSIPAAKICLPIIKGYGPGSAYLALGACTMRPDQKMGQNNYPLAGHHMVQNTIFHRLNKVKPGDMIYITDMHRVYCYKVYSNKTITKWDTNTTQPATHDGKPIITLLTCNTYTETNYRWCVKGILVYSHKATVTILKNKM